MTYVEDSFGQLLLHSGQIKSFTLDLLIEGFPGSRELVEFRV